MTTIPTDKQVDEQLGAICGAVLRRDMQASVDACQQIRKWFDDLRMAKLHAERSAHYASIGKPIY